MERLTKKHNQLIKALTTLKTSIECYQRATHLTQHNAELKEVFTSQEELERATRDSMIQRFEFSVDLFWKYLKDYLESIEHITLTIKSPRAVLRALCQAKLINEQEATHAIEMVESRNMTSHIYKEEIAERISVNIAPYHKLMTLILSRVQP